MIRNDEEKLLENFIMFDKSKDVMRILANYKKPSLNLSSYRINDIYAAHIGEKLRFNRYVTSLNLAHNAISDDGAKYIVNMLKTNSYMTSLNLNSNILNSSNSYITSLNLKNNIIGYKGAGYIADMLTDNSSLTSLDLDGNDDIGDIGAVRLFNSSIKYSTFVEYSKDFL